jgi:hypothetical protein
VGLVALPVVVAIVRAAFADYQPPADWALIELSVRDVGSHTPLVGPFSRYGWNHPGPLLFWVLAVPYRLLGSSSTALLVGAGAINLASIVTIGVHAWRRGRWPLLVLSSLGLALLLSGVGAGFLVDPWNPYLTMLPFALLLWTTWSIVEGEHRWAPLAVLLAAFLAQTHVSYAPMVAVLLGWSIVGLVRHGRATVSPTSPDEATSRRRWLGAAAVLAVLLFLPVAIEQMTTDPGNVTQIFRHFTDGDREAAGLPAAAEVLGRHLAVPGIWASGHEPVDAFIGSLAPGSWWWALPGLAAFAAATAMAWRRRLWSVLHLQITVGLALAVGFVTISRTTDELFPYLFQWLRPLAMLLWIAAAWTVYRAVDRSWVERLDRVGGPVLVAATAVVTLFTAASPADLLITEGPVDDAVAAVLPDAIDRTRDDRVLIWPTGGCLDWVANGVVLGLERAGVTVLGTEGDAHRYGDHRVYDGTNADATLVVACRDAIDEYGDDERYHHVSTYSSLSPAEEEEFLELRRELRTQAEAMGDDELAGFVDTGALALFATDTGLDPELVERYAQLQPRYDERIALYVGPPMRVGE